MDICEGCYLYKKAIEQIHLPLKCRMYHLNKSKNVLCPCIECLVKMTCVDVCMKFKKMHFKIIEYNRKFMKLPPYIE